MYLSFVTYKYTTNNAANNEMSTKTQIMQAITHHKLKMLDRDAKIFDDYHAMIGTEGAMKTAVKHELMHRYGLYSIRSIDRSIEREAKRRENN